MAHAICADSSNSVCPVKQEAGNWELARPPPQQMDTNAATACTLWCTIAMGALVQGHSPEKITRYIQRARTSIQQDFDNVSVDTARAFLMMAYLYNFLRDDAKFCSYLQFTKGVVRRLTENTPEKQEIVDLLSRGDETRIFHTEAVEPWELVDYCRDECDDLMPQEVPEVVGKSDLRKILAQTDRRLIKAYLRDHRAHRRAALGSSQHSDAEHDAAILEEIDMGGHDVARYGSDRSTSGNGEGGGRGVGNASERLITVGRPARAVGQEDVQEISALMRAVSVDRKLDNEDDPSELAAESKAITKEAQEVFSRLEHAVGTREVAVGVGGLLYHAMCAYVVIVSADPKLLDVRIARTKQCAKVYIRYPGLIRFSKWLHLAHCILSLLAQLDDPEPYEELRRAYNSVSDADSKIVPPHVEWSMKSFCNHIFCRSLEHQISPEFDTGNASTVAGDDVGDKGDVTAGDYSESESVDPHGGAFDDDDTRWGYLDPQPHPFPPTGDLGQMVPKIEWSDLPFGDGGEMSGRPGRSGSSVMQSLDQELEACLNNTGIGTGTDAESGPSGVSSHQDDNQSGWSTSGMSVLRRLPYGFADTSQTICGRSPPVSAATMGDVFVPGHGGAPDQAPGSASGWAAAADGAPPATSSQHYATMKQAYGEKMPFWEGSNAGTGDAGGARFTGSAGGAGGAGCGADGGTGEVSSNEAPRGVTLGLTPADFEAARESPADPLKVRRDG